MRINQRDRQLLNLLANFKVLTTAHMRELIFYTSPSRTSLDNAIRRLKNLGFIVERNQRLIGFRGGGQLKSYQIGREAWSRYYDRAFKLWPNQDHTLAIADIYLALVRLERQNKLTINHYSTEPDSWHVTRGHQLEPDLFADLSLPDGMRILQWLEVDLSTESDRKLRDKVERYINAYSEFVVGDIEAWPLIVWVCIDEYRVRDIERILRRYTADERQLFRVKTLAEYVALFE